MQTTLERRVNASPVASAIPTDGPSRVLSSAATPATCTPTMVIAIVTVQVLIAYAKSWGEQVAM